MNWSRLPVAAGRLAQPLMAATIVVFATSFAAPAWATAHGEPTTTWNVTPQEKTFPADRPQACANDGYEFFDKFQTVGENPGTYTETIVINGVTVTVEITVHTDNTLDFNITDGVATEVWFKSADYFLYQYEPPVSGATNSGPVSNDTRLHDGVNTQGKYNALSHLDACIYPVYPLRAEKTAAGSYDRTVTWTLDKSVDVNSHTGSAGLDAGTSNWTVVADKTEVSGNYEVTGDITVYNDNIFDVPVTVTDALNDGTSATVSCPSDTVPANDSLTCTYTASPADASATLNTATITSSAVEGTTATAPVSFTENLIGYDSGTLSDNNEFNPNPDTVISGDTTWNYSQTFTCSANPGDYINGSYSFNVPNTATLNDNINLSDTENVDVTCILQPLSPSKTAAGTYDRTVTWTLDKSVDVASHSGNAGDTFDSIWTVVADKTEVSNNYQVTGSITISNPAAIAQAFSLSDVLDDGTVAEFSCPATAVPPGGNVVCSYSASPADGSATANTATVSAPGNADQIATAPVSFTENLIGYDSGTLADDRFSFSQEVSDDFTKTFPETFECSSDASDYTDGTYSYTETNTATLNGNLNLSDTESVDVACTLAALEASKTADAGYDRTVTWTLDKSVAPASHSGEAGDTFDSTWTVVADKTEVSDNYAVSGTISIFNPATIAQTFSVSDVLNDGTPVSVTCDIYTIPASGTASCTYTASPADASATLNTATVSAPGNPDQVATATVAFTENLIGYDSGTLSDPRFSYSETISGDFTKTFPETFECSSSPSDYLNGSYSYTEINTATLNGNINLSDDAQVDVACELKALVPTKTALAGYDERHDWGVSKTVTGPDGGPFYPGDNPTWTWTIDITETVIDENFAVTGTISISNPASIAQTFSVSDVLNDVGGTAATVTCSSYTVAANDTASCTYTASPTDASATLNTATVSAVGNPDQTATADVNFVKTVINDSATVSDTEIGLNQTLDGPDTFTATDSAICSLDLADYGQDGTYTVDLSNTATLVDEEGNQYSDDASTSYTCEASSVGLYKTTNGVPADPSKDIAFALISYATQPPEVDPKLRTPTEEEVVSTLGIGADLDFSAALVPADVYSICEAPVPAGYTFEITVEQDGSIVLTYAGPPGEEFPTGEIQCFDFTAATTGNSLTFNVENSFPGGAPRTPGYWKNWNTCSSGNQDETAAKLGGYNEGVYLLDDLLPQQLGDFLSVATCEDGVLILEARDLMDVDNKGDPVNRSNDAAYTLARALLAARLNQDAGACTADGFDFLGEYGFDGTFEQLLTAADDVLTVVNFAGTGSYLSPQDLKGKNNPKAPLAQQALYLYEIIDDYNNEQVCTGEPSH